MVELGEVWWGGTMTGRCFINVIFVPQVARFQMFWLRSAQADSEYG